MSQYRRNNLFSQFLWPIINRMCTFVSANTVDAKLQLVDMAMLALQESDSEIVTLVPVRLSQPLKHLAMWV